MTQRVGHTRAWIGFGGRWMSAALRLLVFAGSKAETKAWATRHEAAKSVPRWPCLPNFLRIIWDLPKTDHEPYFAD